MVVAVVLQAPQALHLSRVPPKEQITLRLLVASLIRCRWSDYGLISAGTLKPFRGALHLFTSL